MWNKVSNMWRARSSSRWLLVSAAVGLLAFGVWQTWFAAVPPLPFATAPVALGDIEETVLATGTIGAVKLVSVGAQVTGQVKALHVKLGDEVHAGQLIAEIDALAQQNALRNAQAQVQAVAAQLRAEQATVTQAGLAQQRQAALVAASAGAPADLEVAQGTLAASRARIDALQAQSRQAIIAASTAALNLSYTRVVAPMDGVVVAIVTEQGQTVNANQSAPTIVKLARLDTMTVKAQISEADVTRVRPGMPVYFSLLGDPAQRFDATLRTVEPGTTTLAASVDGAAMPGATSGAGAIYYNAIFEVPNDARTLRIDMTAQTTIVLARATQVLTIPSAALGEQHADERYLVTVLGTGGRLSQRWVKIGINNRVQAEVLDGLEQAELVLLASQPKAQP